MAKQPSRRSRPDAQADSLGRQITIQRTTLSGFRHHDGPQLWPALRTKELLTLEREPDNPYDPNAVLLRWRGRKLGYLPRGENLVAARLLDRNRNLSARISALRPDTDRNARIRLDVMMH